MGNFFRFKLGEFACACVSDGGMNYPILNMFKDVPLDKAETILALVAVFEIGDRQVS